jgi:hypothetical protein
VELKKKKEKIFFGKSFMEQKVYYVSIYGYYSIKIKKF